MLQQFRGGPYKKPQRIKEAEMSLSNKDDVTQLLQAWRRGQDSALDGCREQGRDCWADRDVHSVR